MTPKQQRALQTEREQAAGARAIRRAVAVERLERWSKKRKIYVEHSMHDHVHIHVLKPGAVWVGGKSEPANHATITLTDHGADFPSPQLMAQLMLVVDDA